MSGKLKINIKVLDDLCSRFLLNIPQTEKEDMVRLCFQIELAHWFYLDFFRPEDSSLPDCRMREFTKVIFNEYPFLLNPRDVNVDNVFEKWKDYKRSVPTFGAILLDSELEHVLLVQGFWIKASWGFPKGKVNKAENPEICAAREVLEETGYDTSGKIDKTQYAEHHLNEQLSRLYYVTGVPMDFDFKPKTRGEIKNLQWFNIDDLPAHKKDATPKQNLNMAANCFFMVIPFVKQIRRWIAARKSNGDIPKSIPYHGNKQKSESRRTYSNDKGVAALSPPKSSGIMQSKFTTASSVLPNSALISSKSMQESVEQQVQHFARSNNRELEMIRDLSAGNSPGRRRKGRGRGERPHKQPEILAVSTNQSRGRVLYPDTMPDAWKHFTFDRTQLSQAINGFHK